MPLGLSDLKRVIIMPGAWDLAYLRRFNGKDGSKIDFEGIVRELGAAFTGFNGSLKTGYWSNFLTMTDSPTTEYGSGGGSERLSRLSEHTRADPMTGDLTGHMLPMYDFGAALGWTYMALRRAPQSRLTSGIRRLVTASQNSWEYEIVNRLFSKAAVKVADGGKSVPFADGGASDPDYAPEGKDGRTFDNTLNHFRRYTNDAAGRIQFCVEAARALKVQGFTAPYDLIVPDADIAAWAAMNDPSAKFVKPSRDVIFVTDGIETRARIDEATYFGAIESNEGYFQLHSTARVPSGWAHTSKPLGMDNPANPLAVRHEAGFELGLSLVAQINHYPLEEAQALFTFGTGVNNRVNGFNAKFAANGNYSDPPIS